MVHDNDAEPVTDKNDGKKAGVFLLGVLLGLLIAGGIALLNRGADDLDMQNTNRATAVTTESGKPLVAAHVAGTFPAILTAYSDQLIEAGREGVDAPSVEGDAAKVQLVMDTQELVARLPGHKQLITDMTSVNDSVLAYAGAARTSDDSADVDAAFATLIADLQQEYTVDDTTALTNQVTSYKNTVLESIRNFANEEYASSYAKQQQAPGELSRVFEMLKNK